MGEPARQLATYEDLVALGEDVRAEVLAGHVEQSAAPKAEHGHAQLAVGHRLFGGFGGGGPGPGGWWILTEVDVRLGPHDIVRPDVAGWRRERLPNPTGMAPIDVVPDWICEVLSPSNASVDRVRKRALYADAGVAHYWIVDPAERVLEAMTLKEGAWVIDGAYDDEYIGVVSPFAPVEMDVSTFFFPRVEGEVAGD